MNALRTLQKEEKPWWVNKLLKRGPHKGKGDPYYPPCFPFPFRIRKPLTGGYFYLVYRGEIFAYGSIANVSQSGCVEVGTENQTVLPGSEIVLQGPMKRIPFSLLCKGFMGIRYTIENLHLSAKNASKAITNLKLSPK